eukprot:40648-Karenia_brevis.AAC.1
MVAASYWHQNDLLLLAPCREDLAKMIDDLAAGASKAGLKLHAGKTKILTNQSNNDLHLQTDSGMYEILQPTSWTKYLGRRLCFDDFHVVELKHRINSGWKKFAVYQN